MKELMTKALRTMKPQTLRLMTVVTVSPKLATVVKTPKVVKEKSQKKNPPKVKVEKLPKKKKEKKLSKESHNTTTEVSSSTKKSSAESLNL